jgi:hypothetical protein
MRIILSLPSRARSAQVSDEHSGTAVVLINRMGEVFKANRSAERLLTGDVRIARKKLVAKDKNATVALDRAIHELLGRRIGGGLSPPVPLPRAGRRPLLAYPAKLESMTANALADCQAVVILIDPDNVSGPPQAALQAAFGLSEAQARLAARLASGEALEVVAEQFGIAKETGRSQFSQRPACIGKPNWWRCLHRYWDGSNKIFTPENLRSANTQSVFKGFA